MWQGDLVSGAKVIIECLDKVHVPAAGPSHDGRRGHLISSMWLNEMLFDDDDDDETGSDQP